MSHETSTVMRPPDTAMVKTAAHDFFLMFKYGQGNKRYHSGLLGWLAAHYSATESIGPDGCAALSADMRKRPTNYLFQKAPRGPGHVINPQDLQPSKLDISLSWPISSHAPGV